MNLQSNAPRSCLRFASVLLLLTASAHAGIEPMIKLAKTDEGTAVLERWLHVQGHDRPRDAIYPRGSELELINAKGEHVIRMQVFENGHGACRLEVVNAAGGRYIAIESAMQKRHWLVSDTMGIGSMLDTDPTVLAVRRLRFDQALFRRTYSSWQRRPDEIRDGKSYQVVVLHRLAGGFDFWWFEPERGVLTLIDEVADGKSLTGRMRFEDFREIDGALEPFTVHEGDGEFRMTARISSIANKAPVARSLFELTGEDAQCWSTSEEVMAKYVTACGGELALAQIVSRITKSTGENLVSGETFEMTFTQKAPNFFLMENVVPGIGRSWEGYDGTTGWRLSEIKGFRVLKGPELELFSRNGLLNLERFRDTYPLRRLHPPAAVNGRKCVVMALANLNGSAGTHFFDVERGQLLRVESVLNLGAEGSLPVTIDFSDFRKIDAVTLPFTTTITNPALRLVTKVKSVVQNVEIDNSIFGPRKLD